MTTLEQLLKPEPARDRYGRYLVRLPGDAKARGRTRVTTFIKSLDQGDGLIAWKATATMVGALRNPGLMAKWAAVYAQSTDPWYANDTLKTTCKKLVDECADHGGAQSRASLGTALHTMVELVARGETPELVEPYKADVEAWINTLEAADLAPLPNWTEVCVYIEKYDLVGTFDGLFDVGVGTGTILGDLKTETSTDYKALNHAAQLAAYSLATHRIIFPANPDDECTLEPLPDFDRDTGLIIHLPAGEARCELHAVDLAQGRDALEVASTMRRLDAQRKRKDTGGLMRPWTKEASCPTTSSETDANGSTGGPTSPEPSATSTRSTPSPPTGSVNPPTTTSKTTDPFEGPKADPADVALALTKHDALDAAARLRIVGWLKEAAADPRQGRGFSMGAGGQTTRRLALVESSIAIAQERWSDDDYRNVIALVGHHADTFTATVGALLARLDAPQAQQLYLNIQHAARHKEQQTNAV